jgi:hypothetical protein
MLMYSKLCLYSSKRALELSIRSCNSLTASQCVDLFIGSFASVYIRMPQQHLTPKRHSELLLSSTWQHTKELMIAHVR